LTLTKGRDKRLIGSFSIR
jgi:menaquinone-dependent protoporphyrinogen IX oxidase